jgi:hypothetical protein
VRMVPRNFTEDSLATATRQGKLSVLLCVNIMVAFRKPLCISVVAGNTTTQHAMGVWYDLSTVVS